MGPPHDSKGPRALYLIRGRNDLPSLLHGVPPPSRVPRMNAGVRLVQTYLHLNGYFSVVELPVIRQGRPGEYREVTDLDVLALRYPRAVYVVPNGSPGSGGDLRMRTDPVLVQNREAVDVIIGEVKEGKARINDTLRSPDALKTALRRVGCCPEEVLAETVGELRNRGMSDLTADEAGIPTRIRLVAFGTGKTGARDGFEVISLKHVATFIEDHLDRYHDVLNPADLGGSALGLLHLLRKLK